MLIMLILSMSLLSVLITVLYRDKLSYGALLGLEIVHPVVSFTTAAIHSYRGEWGWATFMAAGGVYGTLAVAHLLGYGHTE